MDFIKEKKNILIIGLVLLIIIIAVLSILNLNLSNKISETTVKNNLLELNLQENITKLTENASKLNASEKFLTTYLQGLGKYYIALETNDKANVKFNTANEKYNDGYWSAALAWYRDTSNWFDNARADYESSKNTFQIAEKYTTNTSYKNICNLHINIINTSSVAMVYMFEAVGYYASACEYYLEGKYNDANNMKDLAEDKITFYQFEIDKIESYQSDLKNQLIELG